MTTVGKRMRILQTMAMAALPIVMLLCFTGAILGTGGVDYHATRAVRKTMEFNIDLANVVHSLQMERDRSALHVSIRESITKDVLLKQYEHTDKVMRYVVIISSRRETGWVIIHNTLYACYI
jgi:hypothetical protein